MPTSKATRCTDPAAPGRDRAAGARGSYRATIGLLLALSTLAPCAVSCVDAGPLPAPDVPPPPADGSPVLFSFVTTDGGRLASADLLGRFSVIALVTTYDLTSQAQLKVLGMVQRDRRPRVNVAAIVLEPPENRPLIEAFAHGLDLHFPLAIADEPTILGHGPFEGLHAVPSIVILDRDGREVHRHVGAYDVRQLDAALDSAGARK